MYVQADARTRACMRIQGRPPRGVPAPNAPADVPSYHGWTKQRSLTQNQPFAAYRAAANSQHLLHGPRRGGQRFSGDTAMTHVAGRNAAPHHSPQLLPPSKPPHDDAAPSASGSPASPAALHPAAAASAAAPVTRRTSRR